MGEITSESGEGLKGFFVQLQFSRTYMHMYVIFIGVILFVYLEPEYS